MKAMRLIQTTQMPFDFDSQHSANTYVTEHDYLHRLRSCWHISEVSEESVDERDSFKG
jgi:hypothetical protein